MEVTVLKTIKRLRKEAPRRFVELRDSCDELIGAIFLAIAYTKWHSVFTIVV